jgi:hypothetical protein
VGDVVAVRKGVRVGVEEGVGVSVAVELTVGVGVVVLVRVGVWEIAGAAS